MQEGERKGKQDIGNKLNLVFSFRFYFHPHLTWAIWLWLPAFTVLYIMAIFQGFLGNRRQKVWPPENVRNLLYPKGQK